MARELSYVMVNPYTIYKSRTGGVLSRLLTRTALDLVGGIMFAPGKEFVDEFASAIVTAPDANAEDRQAKEAALLNPPAQTNYTPPRQLDPVVYYDDGSSLDTTSNIMTLSNGSQVDITTGLPYIDPKSIIEMANGAYLDTTNNILHEADGTQVDATTGLKVSTSA